MEQYLYRHPDVKEVAVYGIPRPQKGEVVKAAVVAKEEADLTGDDIKAYCRDNLAVYKVPAVVDVVAELPKSAIGKILKRILKDEG